MRKVRILVCGAVISLAALMPAPAHAWTCAITPLPVTPDPGKTVCSVFMNGVGTVCRAVPKLTCPE